ncbi:MAG: DUF1573 domain-containing protein [Planctomycetota bacterium]
MAFLNIALYSLSSGARTCGCLGALAVHPAHVAALDATILCALLIHIWLERFQAIGNASTSMRAIAWRQIVSFGSVGVVGIFTLNFLVQVAILETKRSPDVTTASQSDARSKSPNIHFEALRMFFHQAGLQGPTGGIIDSSSIKTAMQRLNNAATTMPQITNVSASDVFSSTDDADREAYVLLQRRDETFALIMGQFKDDAGRWYSQAMEGRPIPELHLDTELLAKDFAQGWKIRPDSARPIEIPVGKGKIKTQTLHHNFGMVRPFTILHTAMTIQNTGSTTLKVLKGPKTSCGCTVAQLDNDVDLPPGKAMSIPITVSFGNESMRQQVSFSIVDNLTNHKTEFSYPLYGSMVRSMQVVPDSLDFGNLAAKASVTRTVRLTETPLDQFKIIDVDTGSVFIKSNVSHAEPQARERDHVVKFEMVPGAVKDEYYQGVIRIKTSSIFRPTIEIPFKSINVPVGQQSK